MTIKSAIQCMDRRTRQVGTFGYFEGKPLYSVTPVFENYIQLIDYCRLHNIEREPDTKIVRDLVTQGKMTVIKL